MRGLRYGDRWGRLREGSSDVCPLPMEPWAEPPCPRPRRWLPSLCSLRLLPALPARLLAGEPPGLGDFSKPLNADFLGHVKIPKQIGIGNRLLSVCFEVNYSSSQSRAGITRKEPGIVLKAPNRGPASALGSLGSLGGRAGDPADGEGRCGGRAKGDSRPEC